MRRLLTTNYLRLAWRWLVADDRASRRGIAQRAAYQRLFLLAWMLVLGVVLILTWWIRSLDHAQSVKESVSPRYIVRDVHIDHTQAPADTVKPARTSLPTLNPYLTKHKGFLGFVSETNIIRDKYVPRLTQPDIPVVASRSLDFPTDLSYSPVAGNDTGLYVPERYVYDTGDDIFAPVTDSQTELESRSVEIDSLAVPETPWIAREEGKNGYAEAVVLIDKQGRPIPFAVDIRTDTMESACDFFVDVILTDGRPARLVFFADTTGAPHVVLSLAVHEKPQGYYFGQKLAEALPQCSFIPASKGGAPVDQFVRFGYWFCVSSNEECEKLNRHYPVKGKVAVR